MRKPNAIKAFAAIHSEEIENTIQILRHLSKTSKRLAMGYCFVTLFCRSLLLYCDFDSPKVSYIMIYIININHRNKGIDMHITNA